MAAVTYYSIIDRDGLWTSEVIILYFRNGDSSCSIHYLFVFPSLWHLGKTSLYCRGFNVWVPWVKSWTAPAFLSSGCMIKFKAIHISLDFIHFISLLWFFLEILRCLIRNLKVLPHWPLERIIPSRIPQGAVFSNTPQIRWLQDGAILRPWGLWKTRWCPPAPDTGLQLVSWCPEDTLQQWVWAVLTSWKNHSEKHIDFPGLPGCILFCFCFYWKGILNWKEISFESKDSWLWIDL